LSKSFQWVKSRGSQVEARPNVPLLPQAAVGSPPLWGWNSDPSRHKPLTRDAAPGEWRQKRQRSSHRRLLKGRQRPPHWPNSTPRRRKHAGPVWVADHQPAVLGSPRQTSGSSPSAPPTHQERLKLGLARLSPHPSTHGVSLAPAHFASRWEEGIFFTGELEWLEHSTPGRYADAAAHWLMQRLTPFTRGVGLSVDEGLDDLTLF